MSNVFYVSDLHLGHDHVSEIRGFSHYAAHDEWMVDRWTSTIGKKDTVFVLGDIAVNRVDYALAIFADLPGEKHLVAGNHDPAHPMHYRGFNRNFKKFADVFATVAPFRMRKVNNFPVMLSHFPYESRGDGWERQGSRYNEWRLPDLGLPLLHGHTHGTERAHGHMFHVGIDAWGQPVPEAWVAEWLNAWTANPHVTTDLHRKHPFEAELPLACDNCGTRRTLADTEVKGRKILCISCATL